MEKKDKKVFLCFGGASGMGEATVRLFAQNGAKVVIADFSEELGTRVAADITAQGGDAAFVRTDCTKESDIENAVSFAVGRYGRVDISLYTPGANKGCMITDMPLETWNAIVALTLTGPMLYMKHVARQMKQNGGGVICTISSLNSTLPYQTFSCYCACKAGVDMLAKVGAMELGRDNIRVFTVNPGTVNTPIVAGLVGIPEIAELYKSKTALGTIAEPEQIASAIFRLTSDDCSYYTGQSFILDGGNSMYGYADIRPVMMAHLAESRKKQEEAASKQR